MDVLTLAISIIKKEEGFRENVYKCSEGYPTVGYGLRVGYKDQPLSDFRDFPPMPENVARLWLQEFVYGCLMSLRSTPVLEGGLGLNPVREAVMTSMAYQLGIRGVLNFKNMITALRAGDYKEASEEMLYSRWAKQTPSRVLRHSLMIETGEMLDYYGGR